MAGETVNKEARAHTNAMTLGLPHVIIVMRRNKIAPDLEAVFERIETVAAPVRA
jgi:hypothetical protein